MGESTAPDHGASEVKPDITLYFGEATGFNNAGASEVKSDMTPCFGRATEFSGGGASEVKGDMTPHFGGAAESNHNAVGSSSPELNVSTSHVELDPESECRPSNVSPLLESPTFKQRLRILLASSLAKGCVRVTRFEGELLWVVAKCS